jgi:predicted RecB family nuclease
MIKSKEGYLLSPSDLSNHLNCNFLTFLNQQVADGKIDKPTWVDPSLEVLQQRGFQFENSFLNNLRENGFSVSIPDDSLEVTGLERTVTEMKKGVDFIYQATLELDNWRGTADFLKRVDRPSVLGNWSYEVMDTKLAKETKAGTILQLCLYAQCIEQIQSILPEYIHVVSPGEDQFKTSSYRTQEYLAYHRLMQQWLKDQLSSPRELYPEPVAHCDICRWWQVCDKRRRDDDHLSFVAGISRSQRAEIKTWGMDTMDSLAHLPLPIPHKPSRGVVESYVKVREQARVQVESRTEKKLLHEVLPQHAPVIDDTGKATSITGLYRLPEPSPGDVFLDFEGDPFVGFSGLEYLTGWMELEKETPEYHHVWAFNASEEKAAFESFMDTVFQKLERFPDLHIYHYGHYEPSALKRMMSRYGTKEREVDWLLRGKRFVDLMGITRQTIRAGVERYSLKHLEPLFDFTRRTELRAAGRAKRQLEQLLELNLPTEVEERKIVLDYNREDCISAFHLREWLQFTRKQLIEEGEDIHRPEVKLGDESEKQEIRNEELATLFNRLTENIPTAKEERTSEQQASWILAHLLDYHWRETKVKLWEKFRIQELSEEEMIDDKSALGGLEFLERQVSELKYAIDKYHFPPQDTELRNGDKITNKEKSFNGEIIDIQTDRGLIFIRKSDKFRDIHPTSVYSNEFINNDVMHQSLKRIAEWVADNGIDAPGDYRAVRDLLLIREPQVSSKPDNDIKDQLILACEWSSVLNDSILPIQGPPGSGKTFTGAHIILDLVRRGKKVGVTALGHKVIETLMDEVQKEANKRGVSVRMGHKGRTDKEGQHSIIRSYKDNERPLRDIQTDIIDILGGTSFMWSRSEFHNSIDFLIVDEAGQLSLADTLAAGQAAKNIILLGDPQQLKQPQQGTHPEGTEVSALEYILGEHQTIPEEKGLFIDQTRRMHPLVCEYISEMFYEGKLHSFPGLENQLIDGHPVINGAGLWYAPVNHTGNQNSSNEEVRRVSEIVNSLINGNVTWTDAELKKRPLQLEDILIIAPYNAQVALLRSSLPVQVQVGTVDKFQGKQAPIVIYSMASSSTEDAPRGMDFLYNGNRLNVAISRAKTATIIVASPKLFIPECRTPAQMKMANAFCRYLEMANITI